MLSTLIFQIFEGSNGQPHVQPIVNNIIKFKFLRKIPRVVCMLIHSSFGTYNIMQPVNKCSVMLIL